MKYRTKPVVIEAFQYDGDLKGSDGNWYVPQWAEDASKNEKRFAIPYAQEYRQKNNRPIDMPLVTLREGVNNKRVLDLFKIQNKKI